MMLLDWIEWCIGLRWCAPLFGLGWTACAARYGLVVSVLFIALPAKAGL